MSTYETCKGCGTSIWQEPERAADGTYAVVWASQDGWVCEATDQEHVPETPEYHALYQRDLNFLTEDMHAGDLLDDEDFNTLVDAMEILGHHGVRVARDLREWIEAGEDDDEEDEGEPVTDPVEALNLGILALNTFYAPDATSAEDFAFMDARLRGAAKMLAEVREWVIAQGEDFPLSPDLKEALTARGL